MIKTDALCAVSDVLNVVSARSLLLSFYIFCIQTCTSECFAVSLDCRGQHVSVQLRNVRHLTLAPSSLSGDSWEFEGASCSVLELIKVTQTLPQHRLSRSLWIFQERPIGSWYQLRTSRQYPSLESNRAQASNRQLRTETLTGAQTERPNQTLIYSYSSACCF